MSQIYNFLKHVSPEIQPRRSRASTWAAVMPSERDNIILTENLRVASATKQAKRKESLAKARTAINIRNLPFAGDIPLNDIILPPGVMF